MSVLLYSIECLLLSGKNITSDNESMYLPSWKKRKRKLILLVVIILLITTILVSYYSQRSQHIDTEAQGIRRELFKSNDELVQRGRLKPPGKIFHIDVTFDETKTPVVAIDRIQKKNGYAPDKSDTGEYEIRLINKAGEQLYRAEFTVPNIISDPPPLPGDTDRTDGITLTHIPFSLVTPFVAKATDVQIFHGATLISHFLLETNVVDMENKPNFYSIRGDEIHKPQSLLPQANAAGDGYLDIAIIGEAYTDMTQFHTDVTKIIDHILTYEPFKTRSHQLYFRYVDNTTSLGCSYSPVTARLLTCNYQAVMQQITNAGVMQDYVYVLVNNSTYGGSGGTIAVGYNGFYIGPMFVHESMGHSFGDLADEYNLYGEGIIDNAIHGLYKSDGNCYAGDPPAQAWLSLVSPQDYAPGCKYSNWYRSSPSSIMFAINDYSFNKVSQGVLNRRLDAVAGTNQPSPTPTTTLKAGDSNNDNKVDGIDYVTWLNHYNQATGNGFTDGDFNNDGLVNGIDYIIWINNYGR